MSFNFVIKVFGLSGDALYVMFVPMIFTLGASYNTIYVIAETRTALHLQYVSLEFILCTTLFIGQLAPMIGKSAEPLPTIALCSAGILGIIASVLIGEAKDAQKAIEESDVGDTGISQLMLRRE